MKAEVGLVPAPVSSQIRWIEILHISASILNVEFPSLSSKASSSVGSKELKHDIVLPLAHNC